MEMCTDRFGHGCARAVLVVPVSTVTPAR